MLPDIDSLALFVKAAELKNLTGAAEACHITVPAASRRLSLLEHQFKVGRVSVQKEFAARLPAINGNAGRDHWNFCYSVLLAGGGIQGGALHGASDKTGAFPAADPPPGAR